MVELCPNHPQSALALSRCHRCGRSFCPDCLVLFRGGLYDAACKDATLRDFAASSGRLAPAVLWKRVAAALVDLVILGIAYLGIRQTLLDSQQAFHLWSGVFILWGLQGMLVLLYEGILVSRLGGASLGKALFFLRIVELDGSPVSTGHAWIRAAAKAAFVASCLPVFPDAVMLLSQRRRTLHDWLAGTLVVEASSVAPR